MEYKDGPHPMLEVLKFVSSPENVDPPPPLLSLTKREFFAIQIFSAGAATYNLPYVQLEFPKIAVEMADALIKELAKEKKC